MDVHGRVVYRDLKDHWDTWVSIPGAPVEEVRVARTILPSSCTGVPVRVMNLTNYPATLRQGMVLGELQSAEVIEGCPTATIDHQVDLDKGLPDYVHALLEGVDTAVPLETRQKLV